MIVIYGTTLIKTADRSHNFSTILDSSENIGVDK